MEGTFLPPPAKRPYINLSSTTTMQETNNNNNNNLSSNKRRLKPTTTIQSPIIIPPGHVALRLLCHMSKIGGVIGKSGSVVKLFRQETGAKIQINELVSDCDEQVILIVALENPKKKIALKGVNDEESDEMYELSPAQEALIKVFERVLEVDAEIEGIFPPSSGVVSCRLLAFTTQIGSVMGKGGKIIEKIRKESGAKIRVLPVEQLPACASSNDEVIQLMGDVLAVKKALVSISHCLQVHSTLDKGQMVASSNQSYPDPRGEFPRTFPDPRGEQQHMFPDPRGEHPRTFPNPRGQHPQTFPDSRSERPQMFPNPRGQHPQMFPDSRSERPQMFPDPRGEHPQTFPDPRGERSQAFPVPRGEYPRTYPDTRGEHPRMYPDPRGEHPRTYPDPRGEHPRTYPDPRGPRTYPDPRGEHPGMFPDSHRGSIQPPTVGSSVDYASRGRQLSKEVDRTSMLDPNMTQQEVSFKLLCSNEKVGGVIGKGGTIVKALQNETGTSISVASPVDESDERVITISALENPESRFSPAQNAAVRVFSRSVEVGLEKGLDSGLNKGSSVSARILIPSSQIGCLMGKGGTIISEMRKATRTGIRIIGGDEVPKCASENEEVVQIVGELGNVQDALFHVTGRLRDNLFPNRVPNGTGGRSYSSSTIPENNPYGRSKEPNSPAMYPPGGHSQNHDRQATLTKSMDHLGLSHSLNHPPSPRPWASQRPSGGNSSSRGITDIGGGLPSHRGGLELGSGSKSAIVMNTTVEIVVPDHVIGSVYGENGSNLSRLRQISGAKVTVHDPRPGTSEGMVIISGTPDQAQAAQSLLQAFIISGR